MIPRHLADHNIKRLRLARFIKETDGSELLEFAISVSLLLMVMFGIMDGSRLIYAHHFVAQAAGAGVRYASTHGSTWPSACTNPATAACAASATNVSDYVAQTATVGLSVANLTVSSTWPGTTPGGDDCSSTHTMNDPGCVVTVNVSYAFQFTLPLLPHSAVTMNSSASAVVQQ